MVNGRPWKVAVEPAAQARAFTVTIKGKSRVVDASWIDADTVSMIDDGTAREIRLHSRGDSGTVGVEISGKVVRGIRLEAEERARRGCNGCDWCGGCGRCDTHQLPDARPRHARAGLCRRPCHRAPGRRCRGSDEDGERAPNTEGRRRQRGVVVAGAAVETGAVLVVIEDQ